MWIMEAVWPVNVWLIRSGIKEAMQVREMLNNSEARHASEGWNPLLDRSRPLAALIWSWTPAFAGMTRIDRSILTFPVSARARRRGIFSRDR
jgi:hypothetical protein